ncbi:MAG: NAD(P)/FAD-dependent oxidoreductase [Thermoanaerobaculia bacterium]|nr:NAD(P)/FAD-dependent oxidoreductase [Thermoanaerobaculia bacterium]
MRSFRNNGDYDAIVVGARVAGAATAMLMARRGMRVALVDRGRRGSDTLSTHALMRGGVIQLHRWGLLDRVQEAGTPPIATTTVHYGDVAETIELEPRDGVPALFAPKRTVLDPILVDAAAAAGAEVRFGVAVEDLLADGRGGVGGVAARTRGGRRVELRAPLTIGADGIRSTVARLSGAPVTRQGRGAAAFLYSYWSGVEQRGYEWFYRPGCGAGLIPTNDGEVLAWVCLPAADFSAEARRSLDATFHRTLAVAAPEAVGRIAGAQRTGRFRGFPGIAGYFRRPWGPGWALVGDASHFKDPFSVHGITDALRDAEILARAAVGIRRGAPAGETLESYRRTRDELSVRLFDVVEELVSFRWRVDDLRPLLIAFSKAMAPEIEYLGTLDEPAVTAA